MVNTWNIEHNEAGVLGPKTLVENNTCSKMEKGSIVRVAEQGFETGVTPFNGSSFMLCGKHMKKKIKSTIFTVFVQSI